MKPTWNGRLAVITGASSGIGAAAAVELARHGLAVALVGRRVERLQRVAQRVTAAGGQAYVLPADLSQPEERAALAEQVQALPQPVEVLINNAGLGWYGWFDEMPQATVEEILQVNITAVVDLTRRLLPGMRRRASGHVINIGSVAGSIPSQGIAMYAGSKAFLDAFTTSLHRELRGSGVQAGVVRPGPVSTEFFENAASRPAGGRVPAERFAVSAERVARAIWSIIQQPRRVVYVPWFLRITPWVEALFGWLMDQVGPLLLRKNTVRR